MAGAGLGEAHCNRTRPSLDVYVDASGSERDGHDERTWTHHAVKAGAFAPALSHL